MEMKNADEAGGGGANPMKLRVDLLVDSSGSMCAHVDQTATGVTEYVETLRGKKASVTLTLFDSSQMRVLYNRVKPKDFAFAAGQFHPAGMTPLYDAMGLMLTQRLEEKTPDHVQRVLLVMTDGLENASRQFKSEQVKKLVEQWNARGWLMIYLGAGQDAILEGSRVGIGTMDSMTMDMNRVDAAYSAAAAKTARYFYAGGGVAGMSASAFTDEERKTSID